MEFGFKSDTGKLRDSNQDAFFVMPDEGVFLVADGVGGHNFGELASRTAMSDVAEFIKSNPMPLKMDDEKARDYFAKMVFQVNQHVHEMAEADVHSPMATTLIVLCILNDKAYIINVGDSRAYLVRERMIMQVTEDHTFVQELLKKGIINEEQALVHPKRNMITRAIGAEERVKPDFFVFNVKSGDIILLCTDGLYNELTDQEICGIVVEGGSMRDVCAELVDTANDYGGRDNTTIVSVRV